MNRETNDSSTELVYINKKRKRMQKASIYIVVILTQCLSVTGQVNFGSIKICHDANKALKQVAVKEYVAEIQNGQLSSFHSLDGIVTYNDQDRKLTLKEITKEDNNPDPVSLQLTATGEVVVVNRGKTITLKEIRSVGADTAFAIDLPSGSLSVLGKKGWLDRLWITAGNKYITITISEDSKGYNWDVYIFTAPKQNTLLLSQSGGRNHFLQIHDDSNKVGIKLRSDKQNGIFNRLEGEQYREKDIFSSAGDYTLLYSGKGNLKKNKWKAPLTCD